jgi:GTP pyrophosphokinase
VFERFSGEKDGTIWYYAALVDAFHDFPNRMVGELEREVTELRRLASTS